MPTYPEAVAADGPVAWYRLGESSGNAIDSMGGSPGVPSGTLVRDVVGGIGAGDDGACEFGAAGYFTVPDQAVLDHGDGPFSIEFMYRQSSSAGGYMIVKGTQYVIRMVGQKITIEDDINPAFAAENAAIDFANEGARWHHGVLTHTVGATKIYRDGVDRTTILTAEKVFATNATALTIGAYTGGAGAFAGALDEVAIYNKVLSPAQVLAHYTAEATSGRRFYRRRVAMIGTPA